MGSMLAEYVVFVYLRLLWQRLHHGSDRLVGLRDVKEQQE